MRRTFARGAKARLSFSGGPHAPVNMANSRICENLTCEIEYSGANVLFPVVFFFHRHAFLSYYPPCLQERAACQRSQASLWCRAHMFCTWLWNCLFLSRFHYAHRALLVFFFFFPPTWCVILCIMNVYSIKHGEAPTANIVFLVP